LIFSWNNIAPIALRGNGEGAFSSNGSRKQKVHPSGFEAKTPAFGVQYSIELSEGFGKSPISLRASILLAVLFIKLRVTGLLFLILFVNADFC
jgi:hypothetical protein